MSAEAPSKRPPKPSRGRRRVLTAVAGLGFVVGATVSILMPSTGCVIPDECILISKPGLNWCAVLADAEMWPEGHPEDAEPVVNGFGGPPRGCACFNDDETQVLEDKIPEGYYATLISKIEFAARLKCDSLVPAGFNHNCFLTGPDDPVAETPFTQGFGACVGDCIYTHECGDPSPHECEEILEGSGNNDDVGDESGTADSGGTDGTGANGTGGGWNAGDHIKCSGNECVVDRAFAASIWDDPSVLMAEDTRLVFDSSEDRFMLQGVQAGSLAAELGLREGDVLESVNGQTIDDLDAALDVYATSGTVDELRVRIGRGAQWVDFTYSFVD